MSNTSIKVENLSKSYELGVIGTGTLYHTLWGYINKITNKKDRQKITQEFLALNNINFEINHGDVVGIVGKNGAGKSTLLKVLSRITEPTKGRITINGRVASLLEVGTGFHSELTGRENIFLNGSILGMRKAEIRSKFDEIVDFSGVEKFLDTPVKRYSSGMYVRLAFAVAAHLEPEILIIDEVLSVGDAEFQKKCIGKMSEVSKQGRTVLFVSHNMEAVNTLCKKAILLEGGQLVNQGTAREIVDLYLSKTFEQGTSIKWEKHNRPGDDAVRLNSVQLISNKGVPTQVISIKEAIGVRINYEVLKENFKPIPNIHLSTIQGQKVFVSIPVEQPSLKEVGEHEATVWIPRDLLNVGKYSLRIPISTMSPYVSHVDLEDLLSFEVIENISERGTDYLGKMPGIIRPKLQWELDFKHKALQVK